MTAKRQATNIRIDIQGWVSDLVEQGLTDEVILERVLAAYPKGAQGMNSKIRLAITIARNKREALEGIKWRGLWPVSYVRPDGQRVFRVGAGHDVPEKSLVALGFKP